jgi:hypothetical protein
MPKVVVGGVIGHAGDGYGFKLSFRDTETAVQMKSLVIKTLEDAGFQVESRQGYHDRIEVWRE